MIIEIGFAPIAHHQHNWFKRPSKFRQRVVHSRWNLRIDFALDDAIPLQLPQLLRQHSLCHIGHEAAQLPETQCSVQQMIKQHALLLTANHFESGFYGAAGSCVIVRVTHGASLGTSL